METLTKPFDAESDEFSVREIHDSMEWQRLVSEHGQNNVYCSWSWGEYKERHGWNVDRLLLEDGAGHKFVCQLQKKKNFGVQRVFLQGCPLLAGFEPLSQVEAVVAKLLDHLQLRSFDVIAVNFYGFGDDRTILALLAAGFAPVFNAENHTLVVDLEQGLKEIKSNITRSWKRGLDHSLKKHGLTGRFVTDSAERLAALERLKGLYSALTERKGFEPAVDIDLFKETLTNEDCILVLEILDGEDVVAIRIGHVGGDKLTDFYAASTEIGTRKYATHLALWMMIEWAHSQGLKTFDAGGIDVYANRSVYDFKRKFAKRLAQSDPLWVRVKNPLVRRLVMSTLLALP